jgi:hypothetical protein
MGKATGQSVSQIVGEFLQMVEPIIARVAALKEIAEKADLEARSGLIESLQKGQDELEPALLKALDLLGGGAGAAADAARARSEGAAPRLRAVNPRIVTRGSGGESSTSGAKIKKGLERESPR